MSTARVILHSRWGLPEHDLFTFVVKLPKCLVAEFNTHRSLSRNSASSRAIPHKKFRERMLNDPFIPRFMQHQAGMAANTPVDQEIQEEAEAIWRETMEFNAKQHARLENLKISKGQANRLLEPFFYTEIVATGTRTEWDAFCMLRNHEAAQTEIQEVAQDLDFLLLSSEPKMQGLHLPFTQETDKVSALVESVVNCARVSYLNHEGKEDPFGAKLERFDELINAKPMHGSPMEHQAIAAPHYSDVLGGNFNSFGYQPWCQYRKAVEHGGHFFKIGEDL